MSGRSKRRSPDEKAAVKTDLFISAYNDRIRKYLEELIRVAARRTQTSLWGKKLSEMGDGAKDILIIDSGGKIWDTVFAADIMGASYKEYIVYKEGGRPVHIISPMKGDSSGTYKEMFSDLLVRRCKFIDSKRRTVFAAVDGDPALKSPDYREMCRTVKSAISRGKYTEIAYDSIVRTDWTDSADVFITDEYTNNAILLFLARGGEPVVMHLGSDETNIYVPFAALRSFCFVPHKKAMMEALYAVSLWLFDLGLAAPSKRLNSVIANTERPWDAADEFDRPIKKSSKRGEKDDGDKDQT